MTVTQRPGHIDFEAINRAALGRLPEVLARWLPDGRAVGVVLGHRGHDPAG